MDFFTRQTNSKVQSRVLLAVFVLAMLCLAMVVHLVVSLVSLTFKGSPAFTEFSGTTTAFIVVLWSACFIGCLFRYLDVRSGGEALASRFGAIQAQLGSGREEYKRIMNVVAEMAIASNCSLPSVYMLPYEDDINAFVVGGFNSEYTIVVTRGALKRLSREQLQALVAHEFGHISQGDIPINMRLLIAMGGLNALDEIGRTLSKTMSNPQGKDMFRPALPVGWFFRAVGSLGVFIGRIIRSAYSRQREFLADATAAQFTRNPEALASVLNLIEQEDAHHFERLVHAEELAHLCFQMPEPKHWHARFLATHPPLKVRIEAIDAYYTVKTRAKERQMYKKSEGVALHTPIISREHKKSRVFSDHLTLSLNKPASYLAVLHAVFVSTDTSKRQMFLGIVGKHYNADFAEQVLKLCTHHEEELHSNQLSIIEFAAKGVRSNMQLKDKQLMLKNIEKMLVMSGDFSLINYAALQLLRRHLGAEFPMLKIVCTKNGEQHRAAQGSRSLSFDAMGKEFALLLSLIVESSGANESVMDEEFNKALTCYTRESFQRRSIQEEGIVAEIEHAFQSIFMQPKPIRQAFVSHCIEIAQKDRHVAKTEHAVLELFASALQCEVEAA